MEKEPLVTVITVSYNSERTIERTIKSVLNQSYKNYEYWIIDGASSDNTIKIVEKYSKRFKGRLHFISEPDNGMYCAMNKGIKNSRGEIIGILNSDDYYDKDCLKNVVAKYIDENYPLLVINGNMVRVQRNGKEIFRYKYSMANIENKTCFGHPAMFATRKTYEKIGLYDEKYKLCADGDWQYRVYETPAIHYVLVGKVFTYMSAGGASDQFKTRWKWFKERVEMKKQHAISSNFKIYFGELVAVLKADIKCLLPISAQNLIYKMIYKEK